MLEEQLDIERERTGELLQSLIALSTGNVGNEEADAPTEDQLKKLKAKAGWNNQKLRMVNRARQEYADRIKEAQDEKTASQS